MTFILPLLPYKYDAIEPFLDEKTMEIHHTKHHQGYINKTNEILKYLPEFKNLTIHELIKKIYLVPKDKKNTLQNNAGGHFNHQLFWKLLKLGTKPHGNLKKAINKEFNNLENFKKLFEEYAINRFGSGWIWLIINKYEKLRIVTTANQNNPLMKTTILESESPSLNEEKGYPIIGLDLWEHAYYLKYQNRRLDYIQAFWNFINWDEAELKFSEITIKNKKSLLEIE